MKPLFNKLPKLIHGCDYNPEQWLDKPEILAKDIELMKEAGMNTMTLGVFSWSTIEPEEGKYNFTWLREIIDNLYKENIFTILATPTAARPAWLDQKYPEAMRVLSTGQRNHHGQRHNFCPSSPAFRKRAETIIRALVTEFKDHPAIILWHLNNEMGGKCWCEYCRSRFVSFLKERYKDINTLNKQWWTTFWSHTYNNFEQIEPPWPNGETSIMGLNLDWERFTTWNMLDYLKFESKIVRELSPDIPQTNNFMHLYYGLDYHKYHQPMNIASWDSYPHWENDRETMFETAMDPSFDHGVIRGLKPQKPFMLMESVPTLVNWHPFNRAKKPDTHLLSAIQAIACGADSVQYFQWRMGRGSFEQYHGAVLSHSGRSDSRGFKDVKNLSTVFEKISDFVVGSTVNANAALLFDWDNRWAIKDAKVLAETTKKYEDTCRHWYTTLQQLGAETNIISPLSNWEDYKLVVIPMMYLTKDGFAKRVDDYVRNGGTVIATYFTGWTNENTLCWLGGFPGDGLAKVFGLYAEEIDTLYPSQINGANFGDATYKVYDYAEILNVDSAQVLARYTSDFYAHTPAVTINNYGSGAAFYVGARLEAEGNKAIIKNAMTRANIPINELPQNVEYHERTGNGYHIGFWLNWGDTAVNVKLPYSGKCLLTGSLLHDCLHIEAKKSAVVLYSEF